MPFARRSPPRCRPSSAHAEQALREAPEQAAPLMSADTVGPLLDGEQDVWLAACAGFHSSPFAEAGSPCAQPFWGCLDCPNAVITARKLPAILAFLAFVEEQRPSLPGERLGGQVRPRPFPHHDPGPAGLLRCRYRRCAPADGERAALSAAGGTRMTTPAHAQAPAFDDRPVLATAPLKAGHAREELSRVGDPSWDLGPAVFRENARRCHVTVHFDVLEHADVQAAMRLSLRPPQRRSSRLPPEAAAREHPPGIQPRSPVLRLRP
jgi:hypothetical protein